MKPDVAALARLYVSAKYTLAQDNADREAVRIGRLFGARHNARTLEIVFPQLAALSFSFNKETRQLDVNYGDDFYRQHSFSNPAAAVAHAESLIRDLFKEGDPHAKGDRHEV